jgi:hypothetical protein
VLPKDECQEIVEKWEHEVSLRGAQFKFSFTAAAASTKKLSQSDLENVFRMQSFSRQVKASLPTLLPTPCYGGFMLCESQSILTSCPFALKISLSSRVNRPPSSCIAQSTHATMRPSEPTNPYLTCCPPTMTDCVRSRTHSLLGRLLNRVVGQRPVRQQQDYPSRPKM